MQPNQPYQQYANPPSMQPQNPNYLQPQPVVKSHRPWALVIALAVFVFLTLIMTVFGIWAFAERQNYKDNSDKISDKAVVVAIQKEDSKKDNEFFEKEKSPLKSYQGPETYGSLSLRYPKTWSAYVEQTDSSSMPVDAYFHPNYVPGLGGGTAYALRVQVTSQPYAQELKQFESKIKSGKATLTAYTPKNVSGIFGSRLDGEITTGQKDSMILIPLRDRTIKISTESQEFLNDFNNFVLADLRFVP